MENLLILAEVASSQRVKFKCPSCRNYVQVLSPYYDGKAYNLKCTRCQASFKKIFVPADTQLLSTKKLLVLAKTNLPKQTFQQYTNILKKFIQPRQNNVQRCRKLKDLSLLLELHMEVLYATVKFFEMCLDN